MKCFTQGLPPTERVCVEKAWRGKGWQVIFMDATGVSRVGVSKTEAGALKKSKVILKRLWEGKLLRGV